MLITKYCMKTKELREKILLILTDKWQSPAQIYGQLYYGPGFVAVRECLKDMFRERLILKKIVIRTKRVFYKRREVCES